MIRHIETWQLRARFGQALSAMYGTDVPAYTTLVEISSKVNRDCLPINQGRERLGSLDRVSAERHGAIRVGTPGELGDVAHLFAAFGLYPAGFYDLRDAAPPVPVVSTASRPKDADELGRNPFRVFTPMLATDDNGFFGIDLRPRVQWFLAERELFDRALIAEARRMAADGGATPGRAERFVDAAVAAFTLRDEPIEKAWYDELAIVGGSRRHRRGAVHAHQPLDTPGFSTSTSSTRGSMCAK